MLTYQDLTNSQKRWVHLVMTHFPNVGTEITYTEFKEIDFFLKSRRELDVSCKISKPLWLVTNNKLSRGVYSFPAPNIVPPVLPVSILSEEESVYQMELEKLGIPIPIKVTK